ncbi:Peptidase M30 [Alkalispirochaeta americana]|uniref:Peptidase M30 n=1 Tax=Alkalispirochaeta americana TaxID=159291 RepID=A0A1N6SL08_9SPIO|nr:hypothetical protein [Alkalispirochaeta americana]SIQ41749.1 Peptidase M30 [Alkalispirochaeta americana]
MRRYIGFLVILVGLMALSACDSMFGSDKKSSRDKGTTLSYTLEDTQGKEIYFVFTNYSISARRSSPSIVLSEGSVSSRGSRRVRTTSLQPTPVAQRGKPEITAWNREAPSRIRTDLVRGLSGPAAPPPARSYTQDTTRFDFQTSTNLSAGAPAVGATLRGMVEKSDISVGDGTKNKRLLVWVADDCWGEDSQKAHKITSQLVDDLAGAFLDPAKPAIYEWITGVFGEEWGPSSYSNLLHETNDIHILLYDIDADNSASGGVLGYFWAKDNFTQDSDSNEKIMFYLDAVMYAAGVQNGVNWTDEIISTLAHEFQHMIHFYQKAIVNDTDGSDTWIDEMCAMIAEDIVADKLEIEGPRGVPLSGGSFVYTPEGTGLTGGRLPLFNYVIEHPLAYWDTDNPDVDYSHSYAFGAFLARNYGDFTTLFGGILQNQWTDYQAVVEAVRSSPGRGDISFRDILREWGAAVVLSDKTDLTADDFRVLHVSRQGGSSPGEIGAGYNTGEAITSGGYSLGSIDLYSYSYSYNGQNGPYFWDSGDVLPQLNPSSNLYVHMGTAGSDSVTYSVSLAENVDWTIIVR